MKNSMDPKDLPQDPNNVSNEDMMRYHETRDFTEESMKHLSMHGIIGCPKGIHKYAKAVFCCKHCHMQDSEHPAGIVYMPSHYFLCFKCLSLLERCKLNFKEIVVNCRPCVTEEIARIREISPLLYTDLSVPH